MLPRCAALASAVLALAQAQANPCQSCSSCVAVEHPSQSGVTDQVCAPCALGRQSWWPCNTATPQCRCGGGPSPSPSPSPPPSPPPSPGPSGGGRGFWYGYAGSAAQKPAPTSGTLFSFPGLIVEPPFTPGSGNIPHNPQGNYQHKVLTQGGGGTSWDDGLYGKLESQLGEYKSAGWDGVMWDWEVVGPAHSTAGFNKLMAATKAAGLMNYVTTTAVGPYQWGADPDATGIDWSQVDFIVPQMYGGSGDDYPDEENARYYNFWVQGGGTNIHNTKFKSPPMSKFMWGLHTDTCSKASGWQGQGCVEWAYSPNGASVVV